VMGRTRDHDTKNVPLLVPLPRSLLHGHASLLGHSPHLSPWRETTNLDGVSFQCLHILTRTPFLSSEWSFERSRHDGSFFQLLRPLRPRPRSLHSPFSLPLCCCSARAFSFFSLSVSPGCGGEREREKARPRARGGGTEGGGGPNTRNLVVSLFRKTIRSKKTTTGKGIDDTKTDSCFRLSAIAIAIAIERERERVTQRSVT